MKENYNQNTIISAVFDAGCRYEHDPEERGLSVILNKLSFRGSKKYTPEMVCNDGRSRLFHRWLLLMIKLYLKV